MAVKWEDTVPQVMYHSVWAFLGYGPFFRFGGKD